MARSVATGPEEPAVCGSTPPAVVPREGSRGGGDRAPGNSTPHGGPGGDSAGGAIADEVLVRRLRDGDAAAGETLCRRYAQPLLRYLQRLAGEGMAEELHQQTWLSVLDNLEKFDAALTGVAGGAPASGFKAWLFRIATNKANDHWRSRGREKAAKEGLKLVTDDELPHAGHRLEGTEQEQKLRRAIDMLPEAQRQVLLLRYYGNMKFIDIAKLLGCPLNTALGRMHKATLKLRQLMAD
jgi:RNA polymerase sigma-70 factor, ECF subfamily